MLYIERKEVSDFSFSSEGGKRDADKHA